MQQTIEQFMYSLSQLFMLPVLLLVALLFFYAFYALGGFAWQLRQRRKGNLHAFDLKMAFASNPRLTATDLEGIAVTRMEPLRIASRNLTVAFSAVILALITAAITRWIVSVRRRWFAIELAEIEKTCLMTPPPFHQR